MITALTRTEALTRSQHLQVDSYRLHLDLSRADSEDTGFPVEAKITFTTTSPQTFLDWVAEEVSSVLVDDVVVPVVFDGCRIQLTDLPTDRVVTVSVRGRSRFSRTGQGLHRFTDPGDGLTYLYSHLEPSDARRIYPCFDQPDLKASFVVTMTTPSAWTALSNQTETGTTEDGATTIHRFAPTAQMSTYLTCFAAGPYVGRRTSWTSPSGQVVECGVWCRAAMADHLDDEFLAITTAGLSHFDEHFSPAYPWGKYDSVIVPEYNLGAMENPGLVTFTERYIFRSRPTRNQRAARANTILHEMSHMWFGDLVTPAWWDDLWLKESFAEYMGADASVHATEYREAWSNFAGRRKNWAYSQDQLPTTHPIAADIPDVDAARQNFDGITYAKGAAVLKQLVHYVGREEFYAGARDYFTAHAFSSARFQDLLDALTPHTTADLSTWADAWLRTTGVDTLTPVLTNSDGVVTSAVIEATSDSLLRPHRLDLTVFEETTTGLHPVRTLDLVLNPARPITEVPELVGAPTPALVVLNDGDHSYAKVRFDETSLAALDRGLSRIPDELTRAVVWTCLWNMTRDGELPVARYTELGLVHVLAESNPELISQVLGNIGYATSHYLPTERRAAAGAALADRLWQLLAGVEPGSDTQLALVRAVITVLAGVDAPSSATRLRAILDGQVPGLLVDPDVRWATLTALAARDAVAPEELDAALASDHTMSGAVHHLGASHARPSTETKQDLWDKVRVVGAWSNDQLDALLAAWNAPGSEELIADWAPRFFEVLPQLWAEHPIEIANRLVRGLYPHTPETVSATDEVLADQIPGALRRVLLECQDQLRRDLRVREAQG